MAKTFDEGWFAGLRIAARWVHYLTEAAAEMGVDVEELTDRALYLRTRRFNGDAELRAAQDVNDAIVHYRKMYGSYPAPEARDHEIVEAKDDRLVVHVYKCAHVTEWENLGLPRERIAQLCAFLTKADHGCYDTYPNLDIELPQTLAQGCDCCVQIITKRETPLEELGDKPGQKKTVTQ